MNAIADLLSALSDTNPNRRACAAEEIFQRGSERAREAITPWLQDTELKSVFFLGTDGFPEMTVGAAVRPDTFEVIHEAMGKPALADVPPEHETREFEVIFPGGVRLDILTTLGSKGAGAIARYLGKFGEGIQQVELLCRSVDRATSLLRERFSLAPVYPETRAGANRTRVNFLLVPAAEEGKLLIELVEPPSRQ